MNEFTSQTGGRFTYIDDFLNLQELALAFGEIFTDCDNFIVSGCEVSGNSISEGIVYLNGKLRKVAAIPSITGGWPQYIYEDNENKNVPYASGGEKVGRAIWGAKVGKTVPTAKTPLTGAVPKAIQINSTGGLRMKDAWFAKYALVVDPATGSQTVKGTVNLEKLNVSGALTGASRYVLESVGGTGSLYFSGVNLIFERQSNGKKVQLLMNETSFQVHVNGIAIATITDSAVIFNKAMSATQGTFGNVRVTGNAIYNASSTSNSGELQINMVSYNGLMGYYRVTKIGDGKGNAVLTITGSTKTAQFDGNLIVTSTTGLPLTLKSAKTKTDKTLVEYMAWTDSDGSVIAKFGYNNDTNLDILLENVIGDITIKGQNYIDLGPAIKEGGTFLSEKYAGKTVTENALKLKADADNVYDKDSTYNRTESDKTFAAKTGGFTQFIVGSNTAEILCGQIGALRSTDLADYVQKSKYLADMATSEAAKEQIRKNIGAASASDTQNDTGWVNISGTSLYARQIGDIVSIQGNLTTMHNGTAFTLPNNINAPRYSVGYDAPMTDGCYWGCEISAGKKVCTVRRCNHHGMVVPISITYMI